MPCFMNVDKSQENLGRWTKSSELQLLPYLAPYYAIYHLSIPPQILIP